MRYKQLINCTESELPQWLREADIEDAVIELCDGQLIWHSGGWGEGKLRDGTWLGDLRQYYGDAWLGFIEWRDGEWPDGTWYDGTWYDGLWNGGLRYIKENPQ